MSSSDFHYVTQDSDEIHDILCEHCEQHGGVAEAAGYCIDCKEYMCKTCLLYHKRYMPTHSLQDACNMPRDCYVTEKCLAHSNHQIKFYCQSCRRLVCRECREDEHNDCVYVSHIASLVSNDENDKDIADIKEEINDLSNDLDELKERLKLNKDQIHVLEVSAKCDMKKHKEKMVNILKGLKQERVDDYDQEIKELEETLKELRQNREETIACFDVKQEILENNLKHAEMDIAKKIDEVKSADLANLSSISQKRKYMADHLQEMPLMLERKQKIGIKCSTFIAIKLAEENLGKMEEELRDMETGNMIKDYKVELVADRFTFESVDSTKDFYSYKETEKPRQLQKTASFDSKLQIEPVHFTSLCVLSGSKLLVAAHKNCAIFAYNDLQCNTLPSVIEMQSAPWCITEVDDDKVAVTLPEDGKVKILTLSEDMAVEESSWVDVGHGCYGVAYSQERLFVSYLDPAKVQVLDMTGNVLRCFDTTFDQTPLFKAPRHVMLAANKRLIYVSDSNRDTVTALTFSGKVKFIYKDDQLVSPFQLATDREGAVYVCGRRSNNIHMLSADLKKVKILLREKHGMVNPVSVGLCAVQNKLYVGMYNTSSIEVFKIAEVQECEVLEESTDENL